MLENSGIGIKHVIKGQVPIVFIFREKINVLVFVVVEISHVSPLCSEALGIIRCQCLCKH